MESYESSVLIKDSNSHLKYLKRGEPGNVDADDPPANADYEPNLFCPANNSSNKSFVMPNELYISLNPSDPPSNNKRGLDFFSMGCRSTPASPEESERLRGAKLARRDLSALHHSPTVEKKMPFSYSTSFVRTSRSEDHLQKSSLTTVNIDIEDELASSLDTLLDTKQDHVDGVSPTANEDPVSPASPSKVNLEIPDPDAASAVPADPQSESSGSEIIPSDSSSSTIRRNGGGENNSEDCECTSEQISAISSLEDATDLSRGDTTGSDVGSPDGSLSPGIEISLDEDWFGCDGPTQDRKDVFQGKGPPRTIAKPTHLELNLAEPPRPPERSPTSRSSSYSLPKPAADSPSSPEDTFGDVSYHELTESYDEESSAAAADEEQKDELQQQQPSRSESPPTDDESDIESLHSFHYSPKAVDWPSATRLAKRLYTLDGFKKTDVSRHLSKNNEFSRAVAEEYLKFFEFTNDSLDVALRKFLNQFCLIGETQERERVLVHFSKRYLDCNPRCFRSQDAVHTLTCALMLLNSDLHGENLRRKMVCGEFIENLAELNDGENFPRDVLKALYYSIKTHPLEWAIDQEEEKKNPSNGKNSSADYRQNFIGHNPFLEVPNPNCATEYKKGYVMRKCCIDPSGKKTPLGKRSWKMLYATLRDLVLYLHKDEHGFKKNQLYDSLHNSIRIHHAFAEKAIDYTKKQYVFRLHTADHAVYLFQTSDSKELDSWVDTINLVAASLSSPPLPSGVGCQRKFQRPLLPVSHTKLNLREQLQDHDTRIVWLEKEYEELLSKSPEKGLKSRFAQEYTEKEAHLQNELTRYRTYAYLLRTRMAQYPELETPLVQTSIGELEEPGDKSKSGHSPSNSPAKSKRTSVQQPKESNAYRPDRTSHKIS